MSARALVVGIDHYDLGSDLHGAVASAQRFVNILPRFGVTADRIELLVSPVTGDGRLATFKNVREAVENLRQDSGERLYLFWAGHGAIDGDCRLLYLADSEKTQWSINFHKLLAYLREGSSGSFPNQFAFVDACATNYQLLAKPWRCRGYDFGAQVSSPSVSI